MVRGRRGAMSIQLLVILVPVVFGLMGFALDLGRLYLVKAELNQAANAAALAAAQQLIGNAAALDNANVAAEQALNDSTGHASKYNFGALAVGQSNGLLTSEIGERAYFTTAAGAIGATTTNVDQADGTTARHVQVNLTGEAPLLFWSVLTVGQSRKTTVAARAVAGISAPVCTACSIEPMGVAALSAEDTTDFGFTVGTQYTLAFHCTALPGQQLLNPTPFTGTTLARYVIVDRDKAATLELAQQLFRIGAAGLLPSTVRTQSCLTANDTAILWTDTESGAVLAPASCSNITAPGGVIQMLCGMNTRLDSNVNPVCSTNVTEAETIATSYQPDTDVTLVEDYAQYTGNGRRIITVPIVDTLVTNGTDTMTILGFRQFLVQPNADGLIPFNDQWGRVQALYIGSVAPVKQGYVGDRFGTGCSLASGPGKVVLHQ